MKAVMIMMFLLEAPAFAQQTPAIAPCHAVHFKTEMYKKACTAGGQPGAKDAAKTFSKDHNLASCNLCHTKLEPNYDLKPDGLTIYKKAGGL